jgi:hypothetical protein
MRENYANSWRHRVLSKIPDFNVIDEISFAFHNWTRCANKQIKPISLTPAHVGQTRQSCSWETSVNWKPSVATAFTKPKWYLWGASPYLHGWIQRAPFQWPSRHENHHAKYERRCVICKKDHIPPLKASPTEKDIKNQLLETKYAVFFNASILYYQCNCIPNYLTTYHDVLFEECSVACQTWSKPNVCPLLRLSPMQLDGISNEDVLNGIANEQYVNSEKWFWNKCGTWKTNGIGYAVTMDAVMATRWREDCNLRYQRDLLPPQRHLICEFTNRTSIEITLPDKESCNNGCCMKTVQPLVIAQCQRSKYMLSFLVSKHWGLFDQTYSRRLDFFAPQRLFEMMENLRKTILATPKQAQELKKLNA